MSAFSSCGRAGGAALDLARKFWHKHRCPSGLVRGWVVRAAQEMRSLPKFIWSTVMLPKNRPPTHPGEILLEEFLKPRNMTQSELAERLKIPLQRVNSIINAKRGVTPETAVLLSRFFETTAQYWMNLQTHYDLWFAERSVGRT
jgi:addiction module HigA family antidote